MRNITAMAGVSAIIRMCGIGHWRPNPPARKSSPKQDDAYCTSIGLKFGTQEYAKSCRWLQTGQRREDRHFQATQSAGDESDSHGRRDIRQFEIIPIATFGHLSKSSLASKRGLGGMQ